MQQPIIYKVFGVEYAYKTTVLNCPVKKMQLARQENYGFELCEGWVIARSQAHLDRLMNRRNFNAYFERTVQV
jgi:hypothetical protein